MQTLYNEITKVRKLLFFFKERPPTQKKKKIINYRITVGYLLIMVFKVFNMQFDAFIIFFLILKMVCYTYTIAILIQFFAQVPLINNKLTF